MVRRSTLIVLGVFALLVLGVFLWQRYGKTKESAEPTPTTAAEKLVFDLGDQTIDSYQISDADENSIIFEHDPDSGAWVVAGLPAEMADVETIETTAINLAFLTVDTELASQPSLDAMGLDQPQYRITLFLDNGGQITLSIGDLTPTGSGYYVRMGDHPAVVVAKADMQGIVNLLKTPPLVATFTPTGESTETTAITDTPETVGISTSSPEKTSEPEATITPTP